MYTPTQTAGANYVVMYTVKTTFKWMAKMQYLVKLIGGTFGTASTCWMYVPICMLANLSRNVIVVMNTKLKDCKAVDNGPTKTIVCPTTAILHTWSYDWAIIAT
jgi:hypothetical protein